MARSSNHSAGLRENKSVVKGIEVVNKGINQKRNLGAEEMREHFGCLAGPCYIWVFPSTPSLSLISLFGYREKYLPLVWLYPHSSNTQYYFCWPIILKVDKVPASLFWARVLQQVWGRKEGCCTQRLGKIGGGDEPRMATNGWEVSPLLTVTFFNHFLCFWLAYKERDFHMTFSCLLSFG